MTRNDIFLAACRGEETPYTPVWIMRQAGRYLPEYRAIRDKCTFLELCRNPELCVRVTLQPVDILSVDAAILFSDILIPLEAMGAPLAFEDGIGPTFSWTIRSEKDLARLHLPAPQEETPFVLETIRLLRKELHVPLIGFAGAPFTCATYLIEGGPSKTFWDTKKMMFAAPSLFHKLMEMLTETTIRYLEAQADAGAQALQLFDSWAGILSPQDFATYALPYAARIFEALSSKNLPLIYYVNNGATLLELSATTRADIIGIDWRINMQTAAEKIGQKVLQGNLDPAALLLPEEKIKARISAILSGAKQARGHIFNLGHGIQQHTDPAKAKFLVDTVHELSAQ